MPSQLLFVQDIIMHIKHTSDWKLIYQKNQEQINHEDRCKNKNRIYHGNKLGDMFMIRNNLDLK